MNMLSQTELSSRSGSLIVGNRLGQAGRAWPAGNRLPENGSLTKHTICPLAVILSTSRARRKAFRQYLGNPSLYLAAQYTCYSDSDLLRFGSKSSI